MTTNQHPGGVAGRVITEQEQLLVTEIKDDAPNALMGEFQTGAVDGMKRLHDELSREARAILGEWDSYIARIKDDTEMHPDEKDEVLAEAITEQSAQRRAFTRLGLDLESEEAE